MFAKVHVFRAMPEKELLSQISKYSTEHKITSGVVIGIIGSVKNAQLNFLTRLPGGYETVNLTGPLEIVCAQGSIALKDETPIIHIHAILSNRDSCFGGHLASATVFSTAEILIGELAYQLHRQLDDYTGLNELQNQT